MKIIRVLTLLILISYTTVAYAQLECCKYKIFALKHDMRGHVGIDVGSIGTNNFYNGIQGTIPLSSFSSTDEYYMNTSLGFGLDYFKKSKIIVTGIVGLHTADKFNTIVVGFSFTNKEKLAAKIGFYLY